MDIENKKNIILIDLSYFIFYRYYALVQWWKLAKPDNELGNPIENSIGTLIKKMGCFFTFLFF